MRAPAEERSSESSEHASSDNEQPANAYDSDEAEDDSRRSRVKNALQLGSHSLKIERSEFYELDRTQDLITKKDYKDSKFGKT